MKPFRYTTIILFSCAIAIGDINRACGQDPGTSTPELARSAGFWKSSQQPASDDDQLYYEWHRYLTALDTVVHWTAHVSPESKELTEVAIGYFGVRGNPGQIHGLVFSSTGFVADMLGVTTDDGVFGHGHGTTPDGRRVAADVAWRFDSDERFIKTFNRIISPDGYSENGLSRTLEKLPYTTFAEFVQGERLVFPRDVQPFAGLSPLSPLVGHWEAADQQGEVQLTIDFRYRAMQRWLFERWQFSSGQTGLNISGIDPFSGRLALWSVEPGYIGRSGRWDRLSDHTLGQVQGTSRLVRTFSDTDSFDAHWQDLNDGAFSDRQTGGYEAHRVTTRQQQETTSPDPNTAAWLELPEAPAESYAQLEGTWERPLSLAAGEGRAVKSHNGGKTTVSYYDAEGNLLRRHTSEYKLKRDGSVLVFVHFNHQIEGEPQSSDNSRDIARYVCRVQDDKFFEIQGLFDEQSTAPLTLVWTRTGPPAPSVQQAEAPSGGDAEEIASGDLFVTVAYMKVPEGGDELYRQVESVWKKFHQARKDAGLILDWVLLRVDRRLQGSADYQYVVLTVAESPDKLTSYEGINVDLSPGEQEIFDKTADSRNMLGVDVWTQEMSAIPSRRARDASPSFLIGFMKSRDDMKHYELERDIYRKVWHEHAMAGDIWNWSIWRRVSGQGLYADDPPFNRISVVSFPQGKSLASLSEEAQAAAAHAAFPDDTPEQLEVRLGQANEVRDMVGFEVWTIVDATSELGLRAPTASTDWQDEEWSKLTGSWRAALPNGGYRIKRITPRTETLEVYGPDGSLQRKTRANMSLSRVSGLNFFTVGGWTAVDAEGAPTRTSSYTSIYKIYNDKWYEQLRGIFAETNNIAPDQFLIYDKIED